MKYEIAFTNQFKKDLKLARKQGKNEDKLFEVIDRLASDLPLEERYKDHALSGDYASYRECHVAPDWLLVYKKQESVLVLLLYRLGSHSDLF